MYLMGISNDTWVDERKEFCDQERGYAKAQSGYLMLTVLCYWLVVWTIEKYPICADEDEDEHEEGPPTQPVREQGLPIQLAREQGLPSQPARERRLASKPVVGHRGAIRTK
jgi:hypothetical protein